MNLAFLLTIYGSYLYSPALIPDTNDMTPEGAKAELLNETKGAFIAQDFDIPRYNIGFDMLNIGSIMFIVGMLFYNYIEAKMEKNNPKLGTQSVFKIREKGFLQGNLIEWLCLIVFFFAFFTFFNNVFFYIIIISFILGIIGYSLRKLHNYKINLKLAYV